MLAIINSNETVTASQIKVSFAVVEAADSRRRHLKTTRKENFPLIIWELTRVVLNENSVMKLTKLVISSCYQFILDNK